MDMSFEKFRQATVESFIMAVNDKAYKNGAFRGQVTRTTSVSDAIRMFINSPFVTNGEKAQYFLPMFKSWNNVEKAAHNSTDPWSWMLEYSRCTNLFEVFDNDVRARGGYVPPPMMMQRIGEDGKVEQTTTITNEGTSEVFDGGDYGVVPGAPIGFNYAQKMQAQEYGFGQGVKKANKDEKRGEGEKRNSHEQEEAALETENLRAQRSQDSRTADDRVNLDDHGRSHSPDSSNSFANTCYLGKATTPIPSSNSFAKPFQDDAFDSDFKKNVKRFFD